MNLATGKHVHNWIFESSVFDLVNYFKSYYHFIKTFSSVWGLGELSEFFYVMFLLYL